MNVMNSIQTELDTARAELLDRSLRNPLINYRLYKARGVEIVDGSPTDVYRILVEEGRAMYFLPKPEPEEDDNLQLFEDGRTENGSARYTDNRLQTNHLSEDLKKRLLNTYYTARTAIEEQGVNTLYLALGMLQWYESESSDIPHHAPLILIPVEIDRASVQASFRIRYTEEDIGTNLSLQEKLKSEFGIQFPDLPDADDLEQSNIQSYYQTVGTAIDGLKRWSVDETAIALGFFSFAKFLMYRDLDTTNWSNDFLSQHPVLQPLLTTGFQEPESTIPDNAKIDEHLNPVETHHVVDADSSQALAIHDVSQGRNLVIQGPPGTGKSQTITNLIAEAISKGKRVLFVAEKMAALEVVKRNLDKVGLGDACLELHSHKMNKKAVVDELKRILELGAPRTMVLEEEVRLLLNDRDRLNSYCQAVNTPIGESEITPYQAYGELLAVERCLSGVQLPPLDLHQFQHSSSEFRKGLAITEELQILLKRMGAPVNHPFWGSLCKLFLPADREPLERAAAEAAAKVRALKDSAEQLAQHLKLPAPDTCEAVESLICAARRAFDAPNLAGVSVQSTEWQTHRNDLEVGLSAGERLNELHSEYDSIVIPEAWKQNVLDIRQVLAAYGGKWWGRLLGRYRRARNELTGLCMQPLPKTQEARLCIVDAILEARRELPHLEKIQELGQRLFGTHWHGESSNWSQLQEIVGYLAALHESVANGELPEALVVYLAASPDLETLRTLVSTVEEHQNSHPDLLQAVTEKIQLDETVRFGFDDGLKASTLTEQVNILERWEQQSERLLDIATYNHLVEVLEDSDFAEIVTVANVWSEANQFLLDVLKWAWYNAQVETAMRERPILASFASDVHQHIVERFKELNRLSLKYNKARVAYEHRKHLPKDGPAVGQLGVLKKEFAKKKGHLPIRKLMEEARNPIRAIKPIFMMSPLSVAKFLPPESVHFDWVVFDEASQVKPVDAFGAIIRGGQTVVVGDEHQLPPTDFFDKQVGADDENAEENLVSNIDSILDLLCAKSARQRMLRWHYRSRHESLITVSNIEFYDKLQLFPSPDAAKEEVGLIYHYLADTAYDRGGSGSNKEEARIVAEKVMKHASSQPHLTLGVATFSVSQMTAIQDRLETLRRGDPSCETFFNVHPQEPFFVKNLENVQGDERDVILISVGYGRDANGHLTMNFGPLNHDGGERRLNVLITRARRRCEVFTNLTADDIDLSHTDARGVKVLKRYLKYADTGELDDMPGPTGREADSPFEKEVAYSLRKVGYQIEHQVGSAGYFIDVGVKDPERPGRYLLGIECDGATYHSAQSARDRDRLRQQVLEGLGWRIHRIWSTDWFRNPDRELRKAAEAIEAAKVHVPPSESFPENNGPDSDEDKKVLEIKSDIPEPSKEQPKYKLAEPVISTNGLDLYAVSPFVMANWIRDIVEIESPVHLNEVAKRIATAVGVSKIGPRIQDTFETAVRQATRSGRVRIKEQFLYWTEQEEVTVRDREGLPDALRKIELIAPEEIEVAIKQVVSAAFGIEQEELIREVPKLFGFKRASAKIQQGVDKVVERLIKDGQLVLQGDSVIIP